MNWIQTLLLLDPARCAVLDGSLFNIDYGVDHLAFTGANAVRLRLDTSGNGTRIAGATPTLTGEFCARIKTPMAAGAVFAFYASTTSTPHGDRDEIDLQFMRNKGADDGSVETDSFFKGVAGASVRVATGASKIAGPAMPYCISWIIGQKDTALNKAVWSANGVPIRTMSLANWTRPLLPIMSYWAVQNDNAGANYLTQI